MRTCVTITRGPLYNCLEIRHKLQDTIFEADGRVNLKHFSRVFQGNTAQKKNSRERQYHSDGTG